MIPHHSISNVCRMFALVCCLALIFTGCGGGVAEPPDNNQPVSGTLGVITGHAVKGPISGGTVTVYAVISGAKGIVLGTAITDPNGTYSIPTENYSGPVFLEITGGSYTDEASGVLIYLPTTASSGLQAVVDHVSAGSTSQCQITPLTTMAVALAQNMPGGLTSSNIHSANQEIGSYFGGIDILNTPPINPLVADSAKGASQEAIDYGLILGGLSQQAQSLGLINPFDLISALSHDFSDGSFDGQSGSTQIQLNGSSMDPATGTIGLLVGIDNFSQDPALNLSGGIVSSSMITAISNSIPTLAESDTMAPTDPSVLINSDASDTTSDAVTLILSTSDDVGVTGYCAKESSVTPSSNDSCWTSVASTSSYSADVFFALSSGSVGDNTRTVYVWFIDSAGNVSATASDDIILRVSDTTSESDTTAPTGPSVLINNGAADTTSAAVTLALSALDDAGVTGYCIKESYATPSSNDSCWTSVASTSSYSADVSYVLSGGSVGDNIRTVYVWFRDSAGNVSALASDSVTLTVRLMGGSIQGNLLSLSGTVTTLAGSDADTDGIGVAASFNYPYGVSTDGQNLFIADTGNHNIRRIVISTGEVSTLAGSGLAGTADGMGTAASFTHPYGITTDGQNLFVADAGNHNIRKIVIATGEVTTLAGSGTRGSSDGTGTAASFHFPSGITTDGQNLFVADTANNKIRKIVMSTGEVTTLAGSGTFGSSDGTGTAASFNYPSDIATDGQNLFVADSSNYKIRKVTISTREVTTLAGSGIQGSSDGVGTSASFNTPQGITTDGQSLFVADTWSHKIRKIVISTGVVTTLAGSFWGSSDGIGVAVTFTYPRGMATDGENLFVADNGNHKIRKIVISTGEVFTLAGSGTFGSSDGTGAAASFYYPQGITTDGQNLFVADNSNNKIRKIVISTGEVTTLAGSGTYGSSDGTGTAASFFLPSSVTTDGQNLFVADSGNQKIRKVVISTGEVATLAGSGIQGSSDGTGTAASFHHPSDITTDGQNLFVADFYNHKIRKIVISTGEVTTLAGTGIQGSSDGTGTAASFNNPAGITTDGENLFVADEGNHKIRKIIISTGEVSTLAGSGIVDSSDGTGIEAGFFFPVGVTTDGQNLFVADYGNQKIRKVVISTGEVVTLVGSGIWGSSDGTGTTANFNYPQGMTTDGRNLFVADTANHKVRKIQ